MKGDPTSRDNMDKVDLNSPFMGSSSEKSKRLKEFMVFLKSSLEDTFLWQRVLRV